MKTYALAGTSSRGYWMYAKNITETFADCARLVGVFDINPIRAKWVADQCGEAPVFDNFDCMLTTARPDIVIVTTVDAFHHEYIIQALRAGCDVITEKPMTIDAEKTRAILAAEKETGRKVTVTFNYRFVPYVCKMRELIKNGAIGRVLSVDFEWMLDRNMSYGAHGASYFRRWNRYLKKSGGLLVHKSTHHFDLVNWLIGERPSKVFAFGKRRVFGAQNRPHGERCLTCPYKGSCEFYYDVTANAFNMAFYVAAESADGYHRDSCVFTEDIDMYDTMSVNVQYDGGALLTYSLIAHAAYEGWRMSINGDKGRMEAERMETGPLSHELGNPLRIFDLDGVMTTIDVPKDTSGHGGGDRRLLEILFRGGQPDPLGLQAGSMDGAMSLLIGAAANLSIAECHPVSIDELLQNNMGEG